MGLKPLQKKIFARLRTKSKNAAALLEQDIVDFASNEAKYLDFLEKADLWYRNHERKYMRFMGFIGSDMLTMEEFRIGMQTLRAPFTVLEICVLFRLLDPKKTGYADFSKLNECIWNAITDKWMTEFELNKITMKVENKWIHLTFKVPSLEPFDTTLTFDELVTVDYSGAMLKQLVLLRRTPLPSRSVVLFTNPSQFIKTIIRSQQKLSDFHYKGGPKHAPKEGVVYYEFSVGQLDCPLLTAPIALNPADDDEGNIIEIWNEGTSEMQPPVPPAERSKSEKILARLDKLTKRDDKFLDRCIEDRISSWEDYERFVYMMEKWYNKNSKRYMLYMSQYGRDIISELEFKLVMRDLQASLSDVEIHILYTWLDPERTGQVEYAKLFESLYKALYNRFVDDDEYHEMNLEYQKKWVKMTFKSPTCDQMDLPTTFEALIHLGYTGTMLTDLIINRVRALPSRNLVIFTDPARYAETLVHCNQKLYDFPYQGGPKCAPKEGTIYYEFSLGHIDCPLLMSLSSGPQEYVKELEHLGPIDATTAVPNNPSSSS
ncbi:unnamed protein product [Echinostoma caproni]|uniref:EF-hand domain-containing protein n=1 Tax=Echinostoma caproni TaxID=27848 RepID=A0A183B8K9_9TREM|nr:unnamed protein product [Echinostoma caproni]